MHRALFGAAAVSVGVVFSATAAEHTKDTPADVKTAVADGTAVVIDVREADEWADGHLKAAASLPLSAIQAGVPADQLQALMPPGKVVYLHCAAGGRCLKAADLLKAAGHDTRPLKPGYADLAKAGFETAR
jgi:phage shock protein E